MKSLMKRRVRISSQIEKVISKYGSKSVIFIARIVTANAVEDNLGDRIRL